MMLKQIKFFTLIFALGAFMVACNNEPTTDATEPTADAAVAMDGQPAADNPATTPTPPAEQQLRLVLLLL